MDSVVLVYNFRGELMVVLGSEDAARAWIKKQVVDSEYYSEKWSVTA